MLKSCTNLIRQLCAAASSANAENCVAFVLVRGVACACHSHLVDGPRLQIRGEQPTVRPGFIVPDRRAADDVARGVGQSLDELNLDVRSRIAGVTPLDQLLRPDLPAFSAVWRDHRDAWRRWRHNGEVSIARIIIRSILGADDFDPVVRAWSLTRRDDPGI